MAWVEIACTTLTEKRMNTIEKETQKKYCAAGDSTSSKLSTFWAVCVGECVRHHHNCTLCLLSSLLYTSNGG